MYFLSPDIIIRLHDDICVAFSNRKGILSLWQLESLCTHIQNDEYYPSEYEKLAHLFFGLVQFHIFVDANKRTALIVSLIFIAWNNEVFHLKDLEQIALFLEQLSLAIATGKTKEQELPGILRDFFGK